MDDKTSWTSIDFYYKGFHIKKSVPSSYKANQIIKIIDKYEAKGFEPSWNADTNKQVKNGGSEKKFTCEVCGADATYKSGVSEKTGKEWKAVFCSENKAHVKWL